MLSDEIQEYTSSLSPVKHVVDTECILVVVFTIFLMLDHQEVITKQQCSVPR